MFVHKPMFALAAALILLSPVACDDGGTPLVTSGLVTIGANEGLDFATGAIQQPGNYANSDIFTSPNGSALKLASGGDSPTHNRPVNWFQTAGGIFQTFGSLAEVPEQRPTSGDTQALVHAKTGNAFVVEAIDGRYIRGWLSSASDSWVTIEFQAIQEATIAP